MAARPHRGLVAAPDYLAGGTAMMTIVFSILAAVMIGSIVLVNIWARQEWNSLTEEERKTAEEEIKKDTFIW